MPSSYVVAQDHNFSPKHSPTWHWSKSLSTLLNCLQCRADLK
ncbi:hypothetical protein SLEP1_g32776 [Rubroshorea leprosula]|uniref:Uncharacterized protein n=1 Tax=Rubroshorea leprosula TaxID=152421 RepID=A0AAV5KEF9_9ROSI|nr:hypothetical protein SLEP1_g32776 [Rubroshorea leprosula]